MVRLMLWSHVALALTLLALIAVPLHPAGAATLQATDPTPPGPSPPTVPTTPRGALDLGMHLAAVDHVAMGAAAREARSSASLDEAYRALLDALGLEASTGSPSLDVPAALEPALTRLIDATTSASELRNRALADLGADDHARLHTLDAAYRTSRTTHDRDHLADVVAREGGLPAAFDRAAIAAGARLMSDAALEAANLIDTLRQGPEWPAITLALEECVTDPAAVLVVCGPEDDLIRGTYALVLDLGGSDIHETNAGSSGLAILFPGPNGLPAAMSLDLGGDDTYLAQSQAQGVGSTSPGVLVDLAGNDLYRATGTSFTFAQGAGHLGGVGLLYDAEGDDRYEGMTGAWDTQGFGILGGIGILVDPVGNDVYKGDVMSAGSGDFNAVGMVLDAAGWDLYEARKWSQGFADGGGMGLVWDGEGNDQFRASTQSQGAALGGTAILFDNTGNDHYTANRQAQGWGEPGPAWSPINSVLAALGLSLPGGGILYDAAGDDTYSGDGCNLCTWNGGTTGIGVDSL